jgi:hypothetical protein
LRSGFVCLSYAVPAAALLKLARLALAVEAVNIAEGLLPRAEAAHARAALLLPNCTSSFSVSERSPPRPDATKQPARMYGGPFCVSCASFWAGACFGTVAWRK